jgi:hypothetical protein
MTVLGLRVHESFLKEQSQDTGLGDERFVPRNFRLDEIIPRTRAESYAEAVLPAAGFRDWQRRHAQFVEDHLVCTGSPDGPPTAIEPGDRSRCPETFGVDMLAVTAAPIHTDLSLLRLVSLNRIAKALGLEEDSVRTGLEDDRLRAGLIDRWVAKLPVEPVFATLWQDVRDLVPADGRPPPGWADDLRDRLGLSFYDPGLRGPIQVMALRYPVSLVPTAGSATSRPLAMPTELDGLFFPPFCPAPSATGIGRVVNLGPEPTVLGPELLHPTARWRGEHGAAVGVINRPVPPLDAARGRHLRLIRAASKRLDYGVDTDGDLP